MVPEMLCPSPGLNLGIEIQRLKDGTYHLHQGSYVREVLERHGEGGKAMFIKAPEEREEISPTLAKVKGAQKITGELLWLASKTRPDIAWAVMKMSQAAVKRPLWTLEMGEAVLAYLNASKAPLGRSTPGLKSTTLVGLSKLPRL